MKNVKKMAIFCRNLKNCLQVGFLNHFSFFSFFRIPFNQKGKRGKKEKKKKKNTKNVADFLLKFWFLSGAKYFNFVDLVSFRRHIFLTIFIDVPFPISFSMKLHHSNENLLAKIGVRCTSVARAYLGLFSFFFLREGLDGQKMNIRGKIMRTARKEKTREKKSLNRKVR